MSYEPTVWQSGDIVTAEKLNKIENGIVSGGLPSVTSTDNGDVLTVVEGAWAKAAPSGGGALIVHEVEGVLDKTWQEISDAVDSGRICVHYNWTIPVTDLRISFLCTKFIEEGEYGIVFMDISSGEAFNPLMFIASSADGYPQFVD